MSRNSLRHRPLRPQRHVPIGELVWEAKVEWQDECAWFDVAYRISITIDCTLKEAERILCTLENDGLDFDPHDRILGLHWEDFDWLVRDCSPLVICRSIFNHPNPPPLKPSIRRALLRLVSRSMT